MDYKTILVHVDNARHASARIEFAAALARECNAHLIGAAMTGLPGFMFPNDTWPAPHTLAASCFESKYEHASSALDQFSRIACAYKISHEKHLLGEQQAIGLVQLARFCDLVVISQEDPYEAASGPLGQLPDIVGMNATAPVLLLPPGWTAPLPGAHALLAWNGSAASARATRAALPLLQRAGNVRLTSLCAIDSALAKQYASEHAILVKSLERHGVVVQQCRRDGGEDTGQALLRMAEENGCRLIVIGCYGHSRFHELLLGGVSRTMLRAAPVPVLMAH